MSKSITFEVLRDQLRQRKVDSIAPVYVLQGEEGYFIDELVAGFENLLPEDEREFNQYVLYGPQSEPAQWLDACRRFPMMADKQLVILKEMNSVRADQMDHLARYVESPVPSTILVVCSRGEKAKGAKFAAALKKSASAVVFSAAKVPEWQLEPQIKEYIQKRGLNIQPKALSMLRDYIGSNLSRMYNEVDKLIGILGSGATVTPEAIERHIGMSKDFNAFEMVDALATKDVAKAMRIAAYFRSNPKAVPVVMLTAAIFSFFSDLLVTYFIPDKSDRGIMQALELKSNFAIKRFNVARKNYNAFQVIEVIRAIRAFDGATKGIGSRRDQFDLLDELVFRIATAPGTLFPKY